MNCVSTTQHTLYNMCLLSCYRFGSINFSHVFLVHLKCCVISSKILSTIYFVGFRLWLAASCNSSLISYLSKPNLHPGVCEMIFATNWSKLPYLDWMRISVPIFNSHSVNILSAQNYSDFLCMNTACFSRGAGFLLRLIRNLNLNDKPKNETSHVNDVFISRTN